MSLNAKRHQYQNSSDNDNDLTSDEISLREELKTNLLEWGINPYTNKTHSKFYHKALEVVIESYRSRGAFHDDTMDEGINPPPSSSFADFPKDCLKSAIRHVLRHEVEDLDEDDEFLNVHDSLDFGFAPHFTFRDNRTNQLVVQTKRYLEGISKEKLDPFHRFSYEMLKPEEIMFEQWLNDHPTFGCLQGHVFEAIVAHHVISTKKACKACLKRNTLRWNGGMDDYSSWKDIICISCNSSYEIKSKASDEHKQKSWDSKFGINGGSFRTFHHHRVCDEQKKRKNPEKRLLNKRYLVIVSRKFRFTSSAKKFWMADIAEIDRVSPRLCEQSFCDLNNRSWKDSGSSLSLKTSVFVKNVNLWASIPYESVDFIKIAEEVYVEAFSREELIRQQTKNRLGNGIIVCESEIVVPGVNGSGSGSDEKESRCQSKGQADENMNDLRAGLESLKMADDDDWENCYDEEEE